MSALKQVASAEMTKEEMAKSEEFVSRDSMGLVPESKRKKVLYGENEAEARASYFKMLFPMMFVSSPLLATVVFSGVLLPVPEPGCDLRTQARVHQAERPWIRLLDLVHRQLRKELCCCQRHGGAGTCWC